MILVAVIAAGVLIGFRLIVDIRRNNRATSP